jgi:choline dehydrogenase-like flavoprotein
MAMTSDTLASPVSASASGAPRAPRVCASAHAEVLSRAERRVALALAEAALPGIGGRMPGGGEATVARLDALLVKLGEPATRAARAGLWAAELWSLPRHGARLSALPLERRIRAVEAWSESPSRHERWALRALLTLVKSAHFDHPDTYAHVGCAYAPVGPRVVERAAWRSQVTDGAAVTEDLELACEVVVIGTGAGGAAAAYELARRGRAVLLLEDGAFYTRADFDGRPTTAYKNMYLGLGSTVALGNIAAPVMAGRGVGGSTTVNSGTCYRAPDGTLARWGEDHGLTMLAAEHLSPYYERVEAMLQVEVAPRAYLGGSARVIARGAELLGLAHGPLMRNAPGCDGQGLCCFGCPTGAKRSTDVSYVPEALKRGAELVTGARVLRVNVREGRARGVTARLASGRTLEVRAEAVIVAAGTLQTPLLLADSGLCGRSGMLGKNLSIHPATKVMALFDETIDMSRGIPQSYAIDQYADEGLMFEGASAPLDVAAIAMPWVGRRFMEVVERYPNLATFGLMIQDTSRGRVRRGPGGSPLITYDLNEHDLRRMQRGIEVLSDVFLRAGAERVLPMAHGCEEIRDQADLERLRRTRLRAGDFEVTAYHPLGTCRMGTDPRRSCVGPDNEAHDVSGLFVTDGSAVPSSLGRNPQMTIMALALRAAEQLDGRLDKLGPVAPTRAATAPEGGRVLAFEETMAGTFQRTGEVTRRPISFSLRARSGPLADFARTTRVAVDGELVAEGYGARCPLEGTLELDLLGARELRYDFTFVANDGARVRFVGKKSVRVEALAHTMTHLPAALEDAQGATVATCEVVFDLRRDLASFLRTFRLTADPS